MTQRRRQSKIRRNASPARRATSHLADAVREVVDESGGVSADLQPLLAQFRSLVGATGNRGDATVDFITCLVALRVVLEFWRLQGAAHVEQAILFARRSSLCETVGQGLTCFEQSSNNKAVALSVAAKELALQLSAEGSTSCWLPLVHFLEPLLAALDAKQRRDLGIYFTPPEVVDYLVEQTDRVLTDSFGLAAGLADTSSFPLHKGSNQQRSIRILDPAMGTGAFLLSVLGKVRERWLSSGQGSGSQADDGSPWNAYVSNSLLANMHGCDIVPASFVVANFLLAMKLAETGFVPQPNDQLQLHLGDCLVKTDAEPYTIVIGNPPYRGLATSEHPWLSRLMRGEGPQGEKVASYFHVDGVPLGERKTWLHDDYVKFFRYAQWQVEQSGAGIVAFVTNHGFLDNPTFRGMRHALTETFDGIELLDLHGNTKRSADGTDESVFATAQGMAITLACRTGNGQSRAVRRGDLRGAREEKLFALAKAHDEPIAATTLNPQPPHYLFRQDQCDKHAEYDAGFRLCEIMPVNTTAAVTARDWFVVDIDRQQLIQRLEAFADLSISDDEIRSRYFTRGRSSRYPPGDTRGWKLHDARRLLAQTSDWQEWIRRCWYRPFDRRWIFWAPWMIDWPRQNVMRHFQDTNRALVCRRQSVPGRECNYFWIADDIVLDGYIRSDNRGSESVFPLRLDEDNDGVAPQSNFTTEFIQQCETLWSAEFTHEATPSFNQFSSDDLLHFVYGVFHSPTYRRRYASELVVDFPRVLLPRSYELFRALGRLGKSLAEAHLMRSPQGDTDEVQYVGVDEPLVAAGYPTFSQGRIYLNPQAWVDSVDETAWEYCVGSHQVLRKWLKDRRGRQLSSSAVNDYLAVVVAVQKTILTMSEIDQVIEHFGGFAEAFQPDSTAQRIPKRSTVIST